MFNQIFKLRQERHRNMPLLTELCFLWMMGYKDAAPTALRTRSKERWTETGFSMRLNFFFRRAFRG
jgi:hypothetical protein